MMLSPDQELDLRWYFTEARGDCGLRSALGGQIAAIEANASVDLRVKVLGQSTMYVRKNSGSLRNSTEDRMIEMCAGGKPARASRVAASLRSIHSMHVSTLEAQYSTSVEIPGSGVSPLLATKQPAARDAFIAYMCRRVRRSKKKPKQDVNQTPLLWIGTLIRQAHDQPTGDSARLFGTILAQARTALAKACEAYRRVV